MKIIIVGAGEIGFHIASHLALENKDVVMIDSNPEAIRHVSDNIDVQTVHGSGSSPVILEEAGIKEAEVCCFFWNQRVLLNCLPENVPLPTLLQSEKKHPG
ncbi:MAG: NAD-binding protein [Dissulfuribacterales bacterium]